MFEGPRAIDWGDGLLWLGGVIASGFLISWLLADVVRVRRSVYVAWLGLLTGGLTAGYLIWVSAGAAFWTEGWAWGALGAALAGSLLALMVSRIPVGGTAGRMSGPAALWEGVVYGSIEGVLLSVLPVAIVWQTLASLGWTDGWTRIVAGVAAVAASVLVIVAHHLGYPEYRGRAIAAPVVGCTVLSVAYLITASPIAAIGGHIVLHLAMVRHGMELPPHTSDGAPQAGVVTAPERSPVGAPSG